MENPNQAQRYDGWNDQDLAMAARGGDTDARNALFLRQMEAMNKRIASARRTARKYQATTIDEDDISQQIFIIFCELLNEWQPERAPFVPYLMRMLPWRILHYVRRTAGLRAGYKVLHLETREEEIEEPGICEPDREIAIKEGWNERVDSLKEEWRKALSLRFYHGLSSRQIARISARSRRTIDRELRAALLTVRASIQEEWEAK